eukprot:3189197-Alexandrium_andersonii.AAC.1
MSRRHGATSSAKKAFARGSPCQMTARAAAGAPRPPALARRAAAASVKPADADAAPTGKLGAGGRVRRIGRRTRS